MILEQRPDQDLDRPHGHHRLRPRGHGYDPNDFFGLETEKMSPKAQVTAALAVILPVALSGVLLVAFATNFWWIFMTYFWVMFPAFGLLWCVESRDSPRAAQSLLLRTARSGSSLWLYGSTGS